MILKLIEKKYKQRPEIFYEYKPEWLLSNPIETLIEKRSELCVLYKALRDGGEYSLKDIVGELTPKQLNQKQSFDIWIGEPFNFAIEFDESQHFNQFRKITLDYYTK